MANPQHVEWLREGVESWNRRRENTPFTPDLSGVNFQDLFTRIRRFQYQDGDEKYYTLNVQDTDLDGINLSNANLSGATLSYLRFKDANFRAAELINADFAFSKFFTSDFSLADFSGANLNLALLHEANLRGANFQNTYVRGAILEGSDVASYVSTDFQVTPRVRIHNQ